MEVNYDAWRSLPVRTEAKIEWGYIAEKKPLPIMRNVRLPVWVI
jgi:hypothetical protein